MQAFYTCFLKFCLALNSYKFPWIKRGELSEKENTCASYHFFTGRMPCWFNCIHNRHPRKRAETHNKIGRAHV